MSYIVLARKWRPQVFEEIVGQRSITKTLQNAISQKRVAHAFLFTGARGVGKTSTARILAKTLNCEKGLQINPCNQCATCHEISTGNAMDVIEVDGASNRGIDEIRELRENVRYAPAKSRYKIYIIDEVHMLTREAFNALLKTLEEPPPYIIFIFATTEPHKIPATILSRCQRYDFKRIPLKEIIGNLKRIVEEEEVKISQRGLFSIAQESEGSLRDAQSLLDQVISYSGKEVRDEDVTEVLGIIDQKMLHDTIEAIVSRDAERCMKIVEHIYHYGVDLQHFCRELLQYLRHLILIKVSQRPEGLIELPEEELVILKNQAKRFQFDQLNHLFSLLLKGEEEVVQSTFPRIMLEMTLIRMATLPSILPIDEILGKLEILEKRVLPEGTAEVTGPLPAWKGRDRDISDRNEGNVVESEEVLNETCQGKNLEEEFPMGSVGNIEALSTENPKGMNEFQRKGTVSGEFQKVYEETWKGLVDYTRTKNPILGSFLTLGKLVHISDEELEIGFEKGSFHYERMIERENQNHLEMICHEFLQKKPKVIISPLNQGVNLKERFILGLEGTTQNEKEKQLGKEAEENPLIQEALRLFDGRIIKG